MHKKDKSLVNIGFSSILTIFFTICLATFAVLSLLTANSDYKLSQKVADKTTAYYAADSTANTILQTIDSTLASTYTTTSDAATYYQTLSSLDWSNGILSDFTSSGVLSSVTVLEPSETGSFSLDLTIPIQESQNLNVTVELTYPDTETAVFYRITAWKSYTIESTEATDSSYHLYTNDQ